MYNLYIPFCGLILNIILLVLYSLKVSKIRKENKFYFCMIIDSFLMTFFCILAIYLLYIRTPYIEFVKISNKMECIAIFNFFASLLMYIVSISDLRSKKIDFLYFVMNILMFFLIFLTDVSLQVTDDLTYMVSVGTSVNITVISGVILLFFSFILSIKNRKKIKEKIIPIILLLIFIVFVVIIRGVKPEFVCLEFLATIVVLIMYHTIENPDMKLLGEVHKAKEISDNANEEKTLFLYNMTQEIRSTTKEINESADEILDSDSIEENKDSARNIKAITSKFTSMTNEILDVSKIDSANIKIYNNKYNVKTLIKQIVNVYYDICMNKGIDFRTNIDHDIPEILYGDSIGLKEVLTIILNNSCKYTQKGFIELDINTIIKNNICRLMITIEDSGTGIKSEDINKLKLDDKSLGKANNLVTLMNGAMMITSDYGIGTKVKIILDQKIEIDSNTEASKYEEVFDDKKIFMVDDSESGIKIVEKLLKGSNIKLDTSNNGKDCLAKIKTTKYDLILLDEELTQISGTELLGKIKEIRNFDVPVILLTKDNNYEYNEEYLKFGFVDYILKPLKKHELLTKINKYTSKDN